MKVAVLGYHTGKAWSCICVGVEPPFSKSWTRHCMLTMAMAKSIQYSYVVRQMLKHNA